MSDKVDVAIQRLKTASDMSLKVYGLPLVVTTSGGKDSSVCVSLAQKAGVPFEVLHSHTTVDAPETVRFIREEFKRLENAGIKCTVDRPRYKGQPVSMWTLIPQKLMPPSIFSRYCCDVLKEHGGKNRFITTGVRWAESVKRENTRGIYETLPKNRKNKVLLNNDNDDKRRLFETCAPKAKRVCNPIIDWSDRDVWDYIAEEKLPVNPLYHCGFHRVGCVGCPMAGTKGMQKGFAIWPWFKRAYIRAFDRMIEERKRKGLPTEWKSGVECFHWWINDGVLPGQMALEGFSDFEEEY